MLSDTSFLFLIMTKIESETVSPAQGAENTENQEENMPALRKMIKTDLLTARVLCIITSEDYDTCDAVIGKLEQSIKEVPKMDRIQQDAKLAASLLDVILTHDLIIDQITEVIAGLRQNMRNRKNNPKPD